MSLISFSQAKQIIHAHIRDFGVESVPLEEAIGRVLREPLYADRALPPYDRVTMDGIAINFDGASDLNHLSVKGVVAAGVPQATLEDASTCMEVMTGAVLPKGADTVIRYEDLDIKDGRAQINADYTKGQNIHYHGEDRSEGELLVEVGTLMSSAEVGIGASIGKASVMVAQRPSIMVISTGDELVEIHETPMAHQIRRGNVYRIKSTLTSQAIPADTDHLVDDVATIKNKVEQYLQDYDVIILSGGVSKGKFDHIPNVLDALGTAKHFHRIAQRPGKPMWFGTHPDDCTVFALPGNPVSSFMCMQVYVMDWIDRCQQMEPTTAIAQLAADVDFKPALTYFLEVKLEHTSDGLLLAHPRKGHGSGDLANLVRGDAFIRLPADQNHFTKGTSFPIHYYR